MPNDYALSTDEIQRLTEGIRAAWATPYVDDIEDFIWEAIFAYTKNIPLLDPLNNLRKKLLFDLVDPVSSIGWSAKSLQWSSIKAGRAFELVVQRADIFKKSQELGFDELSKESSTDDLGKALLRHWYMKVHQDAEIQHVADKRVCILLKNKKRDTYALLEEPVAEYEETDIIWKWTNNTKTGLQGIRKTDDFCVFRWYPNQKQLFERFQLPEDTYIFNLTLARLSLTKAISILNQSLDSP